jgi:hypothetical protein
LSEGEHQHLQWNTRHRGAADELTGRLAEIVLNIRTRLRVSDLQR